MPVRQAPAAMPMLAVLLAGPVRVLLALLIRPGALLPLAARAVRPVLPVFPELAARAAVLPLAELAARERRAVPVATDLPAALLAIIGERSKTLLMRRVPCNPPVELQETVRRGELLGPALRLPAEQRRLAARERRAVPGEWPTPAEWRGKIISRELLRGQRVLIMPVAQSLPLESLERMVLPVALAAVPRREPLISAGQVVSVVSVVPVVLPMPAVWSDLIRAR